MFKHCYDAQVLSSATKRDVYFHSVEWTETPGIRTKILFSIKVQTGQTASVCNQPRCVLEAAVRTCSYDSLINMICIVG